MKTHPHLIVQFQALNGLSKRTKLGFHWNIYQNKVAAEKAEKAAAAKKSAEPAPVRKESTSKARQDSTSGKRGNDRDNKGGQRNREGKTAKGFTYVEL